MAIKCSLADLTQSSSSSPIWFPHFADGGGYTTTLILINTSNAAETGTLRVLDDNGIPMKVNQVGGTSDSSFKYSIPYAGVYRFQTDGFPVTTKTGWVQLTPDDGTAAPVGAGVFAYNPGSVLVTESGIPAAVPTMKARIFVDLSGGHNTGLAIGNPSGSNASITLKAYQSDGVTGVGTSQGPLTIPPYGHSAKFANEIITGLSAGFSGVLEISSAAPFVALTVRSLINERNDFLLTTFPIADASRSAAVPLVFPQIADGGGFATQFILLSPVGAADTTLGFYDKDGKPLPVGR